MDGYTEAKTFLCDFVSSDKKDIDIMRWRLVLEGIK